MRNRKKINLNTINKVRCEQPLYDIKNFIFETAYRRADQLLYDMVCENGKAQKMDADGGNRYQEQLEDEQIPNVISFLGARGRGKTSAMLSFLFSLNELRSENNKWSKFQKSNVRFLTLPYIDAAILAENENVLDVILAKMWDKFSEHIKEPVNANDAHYMHLQKHVREGFVRVRKAYWGLKRKEGADAKKAADEPVSGALHELSVSMNLRHELKELAGHYIKLLTYDPWGGNGQYGSQCYLVLAIDDVDMSAKAAQHILEEIRRFFSIPEVVIFLTADFARLRIMCESYYKDCFDKDDKNLGRFINDYLGKVLPYNMRIHMPELQENFDGYEIEKNIDSENWKKFDLSKLDEKDLILSIMKDKCQISFDGVRRRRHFLQNGSLREMINYFERLFKVEDGQYYIWLKTDLKDRLAQRIKNEEQRFFVESLCSRDYEDMNNAVINFIQMHLKGERKLTTLDKSLGQVLYACSLMEEDDAENIEFVNCILLLYSLMLAQISQNQKLKEKIIGNSLFGEWEYAALPTGVQVTEFLTGFDTRGQLDLCLSEDIVEHLKQRNAKEVLTGLVETQKAEIQGWLYALLFVNIDSPAGDEYIFSVKCDKKIDTIIKERDKLDSGLADEETPDTISSKPQPDKKPAENPPAFSIQMHGIARKSCFGFLHKGQGQEVKKLKDVLRGSLKELARKVYECTAKKNDETSKEAEIEAIVQQLYGVVWETIEKRGKRGKRGSEVRVNSFPVQNVEILYSIGQALEKVIVTDDIKISDLLFEKMMHEYYIIASELGKRDKYYDKIGIKTSFEQNFRNRIRAKIFLESGYLEKEVKDAFVEQFGNLYSFAMTRVNAPNN